MRNILIIMIITRVLKNWLKGHHNYFYFHFCTISVHTFHNTFIMIRISSLKFRELSERVCERRFLWHRRYMTLNKHKCIYQNQWELRIVFEDIHFYFNQCSNVRFCIYRLHDKNKIIEHNVHYTNSIIDI